MRIIFALLMLVTPAFADIWGDWHAKRVADPYGRFYVVLRYYDRGRAARYSFAEVAPEAPPVETEEYEAYDEWKRWSAGGGLREGDRVLARGGLEAPPFDVIVSSAGLGFVGIEVWWYLGHGNSVTIVKADGSPRLTRRLTDLFTPREIDAFPRSVSSIWWLRGAWLDDRAGKVVVVARDGKLRTVAWSDGKVGQGSDEDLFRALDLPHVEARKLALELIAERRTARARPRLASLLAEPTEPLGVRLRAATALAALGDLSGKDLVVASAVPERSLENDPDAEYAISHLPDVLGEEAIPLLRRCMLMGTAEAKWGFYGLGHRAVPALMDLVQKEGAREAVEALEWLGARRALPVLLEAISGEDAWTAECAAFLARKISGPEIAPEMADALRRGTKVPQEVARFFRHVKYPGAVPLLVRALENLPQGASEYEAGRITKALEFQTGKDLGKDPAAWRRHLEDGEK